MPKNLHDVKTQMLSFSRAYWYGNAKSMLNSWDCMKLIVTVTKYRQEDCEAEGTQNAVVRLTAGT
jgi:hypothetical protein